MISLGGFLLMLFIPLTSWANPGTNMQVIDGFSIDRTEVSVGQFKIFARETGFVSKAEREGGGRVYDSGWVQKTGWNWQAPFGEPAGDDEPAVHLTFDEAEAYCSWAGKRLPTKDEWRMAAYLELRPNPSEGFVKNITYPYPTGETSLGANCLEDCGATPAIDHSDKLNRGVGHAPVGLSKAGVNGLYDMGANVWEWARDGAGTSQPTMGGSWWYGAHRMHRDNDAQKPVDTAVVYIGFRCASD